MLASRCCCVNPANSMNEISEKLGKSLMKVKTNIHHSDTIVMIQL